MIRNLMGGMATLALTCAILPQHAATQTTEYPSRSVTMLVPFAAGGGTDAIARLISQRLSERYRKPFVVENRLGAGGNVAAAALAKATLDGYTLMMATSGTLSTNVNLYTNLTFNSATEIAPVALVCAVPFVLVVNPAVPVHSVSELIAYVKANPGKVSYASGGVGTFHHMMGELLKSSTGIEITHVPYRGGAPAVNDVVSGQLPLMFAELPAVAQLVETGKLRAIGITTAEPAAAAPQIPPLSKVGLPGFDAAAWQMVAAPAGLPKDVLNQLNRDINAIVASPEVQASIVKLGFIPLGKGTPETLSQYVKDETARWKDVIAKAKIAPLE
jgi:tripartite-type tricarboxylate transporter receptor subunit TctC